MRFMIIHKTNAHWEAGAIPGRELVARVGAMLGTLSKAGALESGEGLRPTSEGARVRARLYLDTVAAEEVDLREIE